MATPLPRTPAEVLTLLGAARRKLFPSSPQKEFQRFAKNYKGWLYTLTPEKEMGWIGALPGDKLVLVAQKFGADSSVMETVKNLQEEKRRTLSRWQRKMCETSAQFLDKQQLTETEYFIIGALGDMSDIGKRYFLHLPPELQFLVKDPFAITLLLDEWRSLLAVEASPHIIEGLGEEFAQKRKAEKLGLRLLGLLNTHLHRIYATPAWGAPPKLHHLPQHNIW